MGRSDLAIIIPAFNEEVSIVTVINDVQQYGDVIIVDDGSFDSTVALAAGTSATILTHGSKMGYESALSTGIGHAVREGYRFIITTDADGELKSGGIKKVLSLLRENFSMVVGRRNTKNRFIEYIFGLLSSLAFGIHDPLCGMKGYSSDFYKRYGFFDKQKMIGTELLALAIRDNISIKETRVNVQKRDGESRFGGALASFIKISRVMYIFFKLCLQKKV